MKRILVYGMTDNLGGIETYVMNLFRSLDKNKVVFDFVTDFETMAYSEETSAMGSRIYHIPAKSKGVFKHWKAFAKVLKEHPEYKKVYFNILDAGAAITEFIPWLFGRTVVTHSHNNDTDKKRLHRICKPFLLLFTKKRYACSSQAAEYMFGKHCTDIIPNVIDAEAFDYSPVLRQRKREELGVSDKYVICHIGRLSMQKNPIGLINIFDKIALKDDNAVLISIGSGEMDDEVHTYAEKKGLSEKIRFLGKRNDANELLQAADVFLFPSFYEGFGIVAIEAQAAGLPCVLSDRVPKDVTVTENVSFLSLDDPLDKWADKVLSFKDFKRKTCLKQIISSGYDKKHPSFELQKLEKYFEE